MSMAPESVVVAQELPDDLWNEDGDRVWVRYDLCESAGKARYKAFTGEGLPLGFGEMGAIDLIQLRVRVVWAKHAPDYDQDEWPWKRCREEEDGAVKFWEVACPVSIGWWSESA